MDSVVTAEEFGAAIRAARKAQGLRQDQLAGAAGVGVRFIVDLEGGKQTTHLGKALAVAAALGLRVAVEQPGGTR
jgi:HTH-type transcriptional regulator/antitoxin HipB